MNDATGGLSFIVAMISVGALFAAGLLMFAVHSFVNEDGNRRNRRFARVQGLRTATPSKQEKVSVRLDVSDSSIASFDKLLKRIVPNPANLRERLAMTGRKIPMGRYVIGMVVMAVITYLAIIIFFPSKTVIAFIFAIGAGIIVPHLVVGRMISGRLKRFTALFPEAIDLIVRGLKSGLPVPESIKIVGSEMPDPIGIEFRRIADSFGLGVTLEQALTGAAKRLETPEFRFFVISLSVQRETGGNLTETLENLSNILRRRKQMKLKVRALSSEARASAYIIGALPFIMFGLLAWMNPDYVFMLIYDSRGQMLLAGALTSLFTGIGVMLRMAKFDI